MSDLSEPGKPRDTGPSKSLLSDPDAEVCPQFPVFRHPLFRKLKGFTYLGIPTIFVAALAVGGVEIGFAALGLCALFLVLTILFLVVSEQHARAAAAVRAAERLAKGWQFVCPGCLQSGPVRHACGACKEELEPFVMLTRGRYLNDCAYCHSPVFGRLWGRSTRPNAFCRECGHITDVRHHHRKVVVSAVLDLRDLASLCAAVDGSREEARDASYFFRDNNDVLHYVVDCSSDMSEARPARHAVRQVRAVWMDAVLDDPLRLGEALDRLIRQTELSESGRREIVLCTPRRELPTTVRNVVEARFTTIEVGMPPDTFFFGGEPVKTPMTGRLSVEPMVVGEAEEPQPLTVRRG